MGSRRLFLAVLAAMAMTAAPASAAPMTFTVSDAADAVGADDACTLVGGDCTLRAAVLAANANPGADTIVVGTGHYRLTIAGAGEDDGAKGDLDVTETVTIRGAGSGQTTIDAAGIDRVLDVPDQGASLTLAGLTLTGGSLAGAAGALRTRGPALALDDVVVAGSKGASAISLVHNGATSLALSRSTVRDSVLSGGNSTPAAVAVESDGGATVAVADSVFSGNSSDNGGGALRIAPVSGGVTATVARSRFETNTAGSAGSGHGAAIAVEPGGGAAASLTVADTSFIANVAGVAGDGRGGAIDMTGGTGSALAISGSTFAGNRAGPGGGTQGARGGALAVRGATALAVTNATFSDNAAAAPSGDDDGGGALWFAGGAGAMLTNVTIAGNVVGAQGHGGAIMRAPGSGAVTVRNSILAGNAAMGAPNECFGGIASGGHNLESGVTCGFVGELEATDPLLAPLASNGGATLTRLIAPSSRAVDGGNNATCPATDQRGIARPQGAACDIGAVELVPAAPASGGSGAGSTPGSSGPKPAPETKPRGLIASRIIRLPSAKHCLSSKSFLVRLSRPAGMRFSAVRVYLNGLRVRTVRGEKIKSKIKLRQIPQGRFEIRVTVTLGVSAAASLSRTQRYRTCARKASHKKR